MPDDIIPIAVIDGELLILLRQILLDLVHAGGFRTTLCDIAQLLTDDRVQFCITVGISIIRNLQRSVRTLITIEIEIYADTIGTTLLLTHGVSIGNRKAALQEVKFEVALRAKGNICRIIDADVSQRSSLLLGELNGLLTIYHTCHIVPVGLLMTVC